MRAGLRSAVESGNCTANLGLVRLFLVLIAAATLNGCANVQHMQQLAEPVGRVITVPVGGTIATINKYKDLPNVFGRADLYGRKVDTGFIKIVFRGQGNDGSVLLEQVDVDVQSNASVFTRMPAMSGASSQVGLVGNNYGGYGTVTGQGNSGAWSVAPHAEQNIVLPPSVAQFAVPKGKTLTLPTGQTIEFLDIESYQVAYRIVEQNSH